MHVHLQGDVPTGKVSQNLLSLGEGKFEVNPPSGPIKTSTHILTGFVSEPFLHPEIRM